MFLILYEINEIMQGMKVNKMALSGFREPRYDPLIEKCIIIQEVSSPVFSCRTSFVSSDIFLLLNPSLRTQICYESCIFTRWR